MLNALSDAHLRELFALYNQRIWPMQVELYLVGILTVVLAFLDRPWRRWIPRAVSLSVAALWLWAGFAYGLAVMVPDRQGAWSTVALFFAGASALAWYGGVGGRLTFRSPDPVRSVVGIACVVYALAADPALLLLRGAELVDAASFGLPGTIALFTLGILMHADRPLPWTLLAAPMLWAAISVLGVGGESIVHALGLLAAAIAAMLFALRDVVEEARVRMRGGVPGTGH